MSKAEKLIQQGDVLIFKKNDIDFSKAKKVPATDRGIVLAEGEVTGHYHGIEKKSDAELYKEGERMLLKVFNTTEVKHQEHDAVTLEPGIYEIGIVQEYDHLAEAIENVRD